MVMKKKEIGKEFSTIADINMISFFGIHKDNLECMKYIFKKKIEREINRKKAEGGRERN